MKQNKLNLIAYELAERKQQDKTFGVCHTMCFIADYPFVAGLAAGMEFKDRSYCGKWDWLDLIATLLGGLIGQIAQAVIVYLIWKGGV